MFEWRGWGEGYSAATWNFTTKYHFILQTNWMTTNIWKTNRLGGGNKVITCLVTWQRPNKTGGWLNVCIIMKTGVYRHSCITHRLLFIYFPSSGKRRAGLAQWLLHLLSVSQNNDYQSLTGSKPRALSSVFFLSALTCSLSFTSLLHQLQTLFLLWTIMSLFAIKTLNTYFRSETCQTELWQIKVSWGLWCCFFYSIRMSVD